MPTSEPPPDNLQPRYNIAPSQEVLIVRLSAHGGRKAVRLRWGLVPSWAKDTTRAARCINARAETVDTLPTFRDAFKKRRCLVLASGFYEWRKVTAKEKQPRYITARDGRPMAFAGLWERWTPKDGGQPVETFAIITTAANALLSPLHDRMPVVLDEAKQAIWLGEQNAAPSELKAMLQPYPPERMQVWPVDKRVGNVKNDDPALIERTSNLL